MYIKKYIKKVYEKVCVAMSATGALYSSCGKKCGQEVWPREVWNISVLGCLISLYIIYKEYTTYPNTEKKPGL